MKFDIRDLKQIFQDKEARILANSISAKGIAREAKSYYAPYTNPISGTKGTILKQCNRYNVDECISYYKEMLNSDTRNHVRDGIARNLERLLKVKEYLDDKRI